MNPLELRKQLLIAESELNRSQLVEAWQAMASDAHALSRRARTIGSFASAAAALVAGVASFRRRSKSTPSVEKTPWWQTLLKGAQLAGSLWSEFRARSKQ